MSMSLFIVLQSKPWFCSYVASYVSLPPPSPSPSRFIPIFCFRPSFLYKLARKRLLHMLHKGDFVLGYYHTGSFPPPSPSPSPSHSRFISIFCFRPSFLYKLVRKRLLHKLHKGDFVLGYYHTGSFPPSPSHSRFISIFCFRPSFLYKLVRKRLLHKLHKGDFVLGYYHTGSLSELLIFFFYQ